MHEWELLANQTESKGIGDLLPGLAYAVLSIKQTDIAILRS